MRSQERLLHSVDVNEFFRANNCDFVEIREVSEHSMDISQGVNHFPAEYGH